MKKFSVSLIGCGKIGFLYDYAKRNGVPLTHFTNFYESRNFSLEAVVDPNERILKIIEKKFKIKTYTDYSQFLQAGVTDVVCVASPDDTHSEILEELAHYRPKLVFCEKPLALNSEDARHIIRLFEKKKIPLLVNYSRRFIKEYADLKRLIENKSLGKIQSLLIYYSRGLMHNGSHYLDLILWYFGQPDDIGYESERPGLYGGDTTINCSMFYKSGLEVRMIGIDTSNLIVNEIDLLGDKGRVMINTDGLMEIFSVKKDPVFKDYRRFVLDRKLKISSNIALKNAAKNIYACLNNGRSLLSPGRDSARIFDLIDDIRRATHGKTCN